MLKKDNFRIYLRALEVNDSNSTFKWRQDPVYKQGVVSTSRFISIETEKRWMERIIQNHEQGKEIRLAVVLKDNNAMVGMMYLTNIDYINGTATVGSLVGVNENRGKGYISEARYLLFEYAFTQLNLQRISATILESNINSIKSVEKFGYVKEGILRNAVFKDGKYQNLIAYSMLKEEFMQKYNDGNNSWQIK